MIYRLVSGTTRACSEVEKRRDTPDVFNMPTKRVNVMSVNPTKTTPAPVAGGRGRGGRGRGGRGRSRELTILDHGAVGEDAVEPLPRSPSSSPQVSPTCSRSGSGESLVLLPSHASRRRKALILVISSSICSNYHKYLHNHKVASYMYLHCICICTTIK